MQHADTLIISDVHLGSPVSRSQELLHELKKWDFKQLILLGDIFDDLNFRRLHKNDWEFLSYIRELSKPEKKIAIVWIEGNHDVGISQIAASFLGIEVHKKDFIWKEDGVSYCAIHGHQFDRFLTNNVVISALASWFYLLIQRIDTKAQHISRFVKRASKGWLRLSKKIARGALHYAEHSGVSVIFCGHTHQTLQVEAHGIHYYNTGCWTDIPSTFITISEGTIEIHEVY